MRSSTLTTRKIYQRNRRQRAYFRAVRIQGLKDTTGKASTVLLFTVVVTCLYLRELGQHSTQMEVEDSQMVVEEERAH